MYYENVLASAEGIVQLAGADPYNPCFGQTITIQHPQGFTTRYAHLSQIYVTPGQNVWRGEVIAQSGNTGCSSGPHLHFGVYVTSSWTAVDPWGWWGAAGADPWPSDAGNLWLTGYAQFPLPSAPGNVNAIAGNASATVSWTPPTFDGGSGISSYTVTTSPGGATQSVGGNTTSAVVTGLTNGTAYTFTVTAVNGVGANQSPASTAVVPSGWLGQYRPMTSLRILDTRYGIGGIASPLGQQATINIPVVGRGEVPAGGVAAVVMNATVTQSTASGYITVYPTGSARPSTSAVNFQTGQTVANLVEMSVGTCGDVTVFTIPPSRHSPPRPLAGATRRPHDTRRVAEPRHQPDVALRILRPRRRDRNRDPDRFRPDAIADRDQRQRVELPDRVSLRVQPAVDVEPEFRPRPDDLEPGDRAARQRRKDHPVQLCRPGARGGRRGRVVYRQHRGRQQ